MAKYSKGAQKTVESAMRRMKKGTLESGRSGRKVTNPKQAVAIGLSEAREKGAKVPAPKKSAKKTAKKTARKTSRKTTAKKPAPRITTKKSTSQKRSKSSSR
ncbi:DUF6496 domain-containing protein [Flavihumibacter solisilvae]|uniref:Histone H1-like protein n=1 Tax=Flavihumibacter solisilvae TaxID=1349421 RepID=A0A0C1ITM0_9BACT|nr:DUF6496 domain-containing protein [Flavihumibacter solisilvae]KIC93799.1 hypothetical protein OI18_15665 [Flavihumibacter solisilvae]